jgi:hypothetical protein
MWEVREPGTIIQAAERAAEGGNFAAAEHLLREAARLQETELGPRHPDLANTLNNLGIVCEMTGKPDEAEQYFRRAVSIARTSLPPDHPFVATSQKNLRDFCEARGKQIEVAAIAAVPTPEPAAPAIAEEPSEEPTPEPAEEPTPAPAAELTPAPAPDPEPEAAPALALELEPEAEAEPPAHVQAAETSSEPVQVPVASAVAVEEDQQLPANKLFLRVALGGLGPMAMLMVILAAGLPRLGAPELAVPPPAIPTGSPLDAAPEPEPAPVDPITTRTATESTVATASHEPADESDDSDITPASAPASSTAPSPAPVVVRASLCGELDDWACDPADRPVPQGPLFFYTQIQAASVTTVQHRWYQNDRLLQTVKLRVQPNRTDGYRTYSRNVMTTDSAGNWRIELRGEDGALLHEERFTVR